MIAFGLFCLAAGVPTVLFLRRIRALRLSWNYASVLAVPIVIGLWVAIELVVDLGRL